MQFSGVTLMAQKFGGPLVHQAKLLGILCSDKVRFLGLNLQCVSYWLEFQIDSVPKTDDQPGKVANERMDVSFIEETEAEKPVDKTSKVKFII